MISYTRELSKPQHVYEKSKKDEFNEQETRVSIFKRKRKTTPYLPQKEIYELSK